MRFRHRPQQIVVFVGFHDFVVANRDIGVFARQCIGEFALRIAVRTGRALEYMQRDRRRGLVFLRPIGLGDRDRGLERQQQERKRQRQAVKECGIETCGKDSWERPRATRDRAVIV